MRATSTRISVWAATAAVAAVTTVSLGGCTASVRPDVSYVEVSSAPVDVRAYPHTTYDGRDVYYVNDRWMYNDRGRWAYYREEPPELYRYRRYPPQQYAPPPTYAPPRYAPTQVAPPAYGQPGYGQPGYGQPRPYPSAPQAAPPAVRTQ